MRHTHGYAQRVGGLIISHKPGVHHDWDLTTDDMHPHNCGLCGEICWMTERAMRFHGMNPDLPVVCCVCGHLGEQLLEMALPNAMMVRRPVPDLAESGTFN